MEKKSSTPDIAASELEAARALVQSDGNAFHARVATYFRQKDWKVIISPYYVDNATGQAREVDLLCEKSWPYFPHPFQDIYGAYKIRLFVECKYLKQSIAFWFDKANMSLSTKWLEGNTPFTRNHPATFAKHRYVSNGSVVAKLFRGGGDNDPIYRGLAQSLGALIQRRHGKSFSKLAPKFGRVAEEKRVQYPVIVCGGPGRFFQTDIDDASGDVQPVEGNFLLEVDYAYTGETSIKEEHFLIDIVRFDALDVFLSDLEIEAAQAALVLNK